MRSYWARQHVGSHAAGMPRPSNRNPSNLAREAALALEEATRDVILRADEAIYLIFAVVLMAVALITPRSLPQRFPAAPSPTKLVFGLGSVNMATAFAAM
jgi:hypothetical protein